MSFKTETKVVRFGSEDVIATSVGFTAGKFGNGTAGDGYVTFNGSKYTFSSNSDVSSFITALYSSQGISNAGINANTGNASQSLRDTFRAETTGTGTKGDWNGTYVYDPGATWENSTGKTFTGVFFKQ